MKLPVLSSVLLAALAVTASGAIAATGDVVVQAGHQGRPASCAPNHVPRNKCNLGAAGSGASEIMWTPIVADAATAVLRAHGLTVIRRPADYQGTDTARAAVFLHFDGSKLCTTGASAGFPPGTSRAFVSAWEKRYRAFTGAAVPFTGENISAGERQYYAFKKVHAPQKMIIEFSNMGCPSQVAFAKPRLKAMGGEVAAFLIGFLKP